VDVCAQRILNAIRRRQEEVWIGGRETYAVYLKRFFPRLFSKIIRKAKVT
jgi:dehydrogenase/reductase SDR family protein 7B